MSIKHAFTLTLIGGGLVMLGCGDSTGRLIAQLNDGEPQTRRTAVRALADEHNNRTDVAEALRLAIQDADLDVRELAITALGRMGPAAESSLPALETALEDAAPSVRIVAALAIQKIDPARRSYEPVLLDALQTGHATMFLEVGQMGPDAEWAVPTLVKLLTHQRPQIRALAARALGEIGVADGDVEAALERRLRDDAPAVRKAAQRAFEQIQAPPAELIQ